MTDKFKQRMLYCTTLFSDILPIYEPKQRAVIRSIANADIAEIFPDFFAQIARYAIKEKESALPYLQFCYESLGYILEYTDNPPQVDTKQIEKFEEKLKTQIDGWRPESRNKNVEKSLKGWKK